MLLPPMRGQVMLIARTAYMHIYMRIYMYIRQDLAKFARVPARRRALPARPGGGGWAAAARLSAGSCRALAVLSRPAPGRRRLGLRPREGREKGRREGSFVPEPAGALPRGSERGAAGGEPSRAEPSHAGRPGCGRAVREPAADPSVDIGRTARLSCRAWKGGEGRWCIYLFFFFPPFLLLFFFFLLNR